MVLAAQEEPVEPLLAELETQAPLAATPHLVACLLLMVAAAGLKGEIPRSAVAVGVVGARE